MTTVIIQARMGAARLLGKVLMDIEGKPMLTRVIERVKAANLVDGVVVATTLNPSDISILELAWKLGVKVYRGSEADVLDRYHGAAQFIHASTVVRITADCPLLDWQIVDGAIQYFLLEGFDYLTNRPSYPDGFDVEVMRVDALQKAWRWAKLADEREHVTLFFQRHPKLFKVGQMVYDCSLPQSWKFSVDTLEDLGRVRQVYRIYGEWAGLAEVVEFARRETANAIC